MAVHTRSSATTSNAALIAHCREVIGQHGESMSDEQVERLRHEAEDMARVLIGMFLQSKSPQAPTP